MKKLNYTGESTMNYRETDERCPCCGATLEDRKKNKPDEPHGLQTCPHCSSRKCCMCDLGDDVSCLNCNGDDEDDEDED